jgi:hypothetical protein
VCVCLHMCVCTYSFFRVYGHAHMPLTSEVHFEIFMIDLVSPKNALFVLVWSPTIAMPPFAGDRGGGNKGQDGEKMDDLEGSGGDRSLTKTTEGMPFVGGVGKGGGIGRRDEALCAYLKEMTRMWLHTIQV